MEKCGFIEYGWKSSKWCVVHPPDTGCSSTKAGAKDCGGGGGNTGVHAFAYLAAPPAVESEPTEAPAEYGEGFNPYEVSEEPSSEEEVAEDFPDLGAGCCANRDPSAFVFKGMAADLDACKAKCQSLGECGFIEYGWKNSKWCTVIPSGTDCSTLAAGPKDCGSGGGDNGVHT